MIPRFVFIVHPLSPVARRLIGLRIANFGLFSGQQNEGGPDAVDEVARVRLRLPISGGGGIGRSGGVIEGVIAAVPLLPEQILADQQSALRQMERAAQIAAPISFVGLGGALSVVAGRGTALQESCGLPVTTGNAATAWAAVTLCRRVLREPGSSPGRQRVAVLGTKGTVGKAVAELLRADGFEVGADPEDLRSWPVVAGCHTTGIGLDPDRLAPDATLIDVALPRTLARRPPPTMRVLKGESLILPPGWERDLWGWALHILAGYGTRSVYACLIEPMVALAAGRETAWQQGKRLSAETVQQFGAAAEALGFAPEIRRLPG